MMQDIGYSPLEDCQGPEDLARFPITNRQDLNDLIHFEFLDADGRPVSAGQPGRVIVTDLLIRLMPFIRYEHGDWAVFEYRSLPSGQAVRVITEVIGRDSDLAVLPGGRIRSFNCFDNTMKNLDSVSQYRFVQHSSDRIEIQIACEPSYFESIRHRLVGQLVRELGAALCLEPIHVERIDPDPTGKLRTFVSEVAQ
jgi:phenylacetate-CoA ligase